MRQINSKAPDFKTTEKLPLHLWEIKIPVADNDGIPFSEDHHDAFRRILCSISGGLTCNRGLEGEWEYETKLYCEAIIAMQFRAVRADAERIAVHARKYYRQITIMVHKVADASDVLFIGDDGVSQ